MASHILIRLAQPRVIAIAWKRKWKNEIMPQSTALSPLDRRRLAVLNHLVAYHGYQHWWESDDRLADWVAMILIQQTTQANAEKALANLTDVLSVEWLHKVAPDELEQRIRPAGFFKQKARYLKNLMRWFAKFNFDLSACQALGNDALRTELLQIKGIGSETADVMLLYIFQRKVFIADQYALRLFKRLGLGDYPNYDAMRKDFNHLTEHCSLKQCKEWHACIDVHGKAFRLDKNFDESFLTMAAAIAVDTTDS
ncbi:endonuclease III domain-containing protein [Testudinibacter sp. P80/BLE/0925]|uniref:endonuclease III domain-containing protein n=1 Tax=Testudinibacter sp. TW-1 TaxID=3417757 RepID=UPI003D360AFF